MAPRGCSAGKDGTHAVQRSPATPWARCRAPPQFGPRIVVFSVAARYQFAQSTGVVVIAVLGSSAVDRAIASATSRETKYPHDFFASRTAAIAWLKKVIQSRD
jgi:hypothetical protein